MLLRQSGELHQLQQLALTPQLQQAIRLLQCSAQDLEQEIAQALLDNPLLELDEDAPLAADAVTSPDTTHQEGAVAGPEPAFPVGAQEREGEYEFPDVGEAVTLRHHLHEQLSLKRTTWRDRVLVGLLIDELDENGYLTTPIDALTSLLPGELAVERDEWKTALSLLQSFDPAGVGAGSAGECLQLQLRRFNAQACPAILACAYELAGKYLDLLALGDVAGLCHRLGCSQEVLRDARRLLMSLDPKPGRNWAQSLAGYIKPEVIVRKKAGVWVAVINPYAAPALRVHAYYEQVLKQSGHADEFKPLQTMLHSAHGLIKSVHQRFDTILRVANAIVQHQQAFFNEGEQALRPLGLRDIAQELRMHESTVSRSTRQKYMQTPRGVFELKQFFSTSVSRDDGEATSAAAVHSLIQSLVEQEPKAAPLSDNLIASMLARHGVVIARRTVAKYREAAGIPPVALRRARARLESSI